jgi:hypothetical protein
MTRDLITGDLMVTSTKEIALKFPSATLGNLYTSPCTFPHSRSWVGQASGEIKLNINEQQMLGLALAHEVDLKTLENCPSLGQMASLDLSTANYSAGLLAGILKITKLIELRLDFLKLTSQDFVNLNECPTLRTIWLTGTTTEDDFLPLLKGLSGLENIVLKSTAVGDKGMTDLAALPSLKTLHLPNSVGDSGVAALAQSKSLADLDISYSKISCKAIAALSQLKSLHTLYVNDTGLGDEAVADFKNIFGLKVLFLNGTKVSDKSIDQLAEANLEHLELRDTRATEIGIARLRSKLRDCAIFGP